MGELWSIGVSIMRIMEGSDPVIMSQHRIGMAYVRNLQYFFTFWYILDTKHKSIMMETN